MGPSGGDRRLPNSPAATSPRSFYKIIVPSMMNDHKLRIPEDFAKIYGNELSTFATLTVPSGRDWRVGVEKADTMIWLHDGWKEFAEHHSISCGFFIVFNYEGNSNFYVLIFDLTAAEIHYPRNTLGNSEEPNHGKQCPLSNKGKRGRGDFVETLCCSVPRPVCVSLENNNFDEFLYRRIGTECNRSYLKKLFEFAPEFSLRMYKHGRFLTTNKRHKMAGELKIVKLENVTMSCEGNPKASEMPNSHGSLLDKPKKEKHNLTKNFENLHEEVPFLRHCGPSSENKLKTRINDENNSVLIQEATRRSNDIGSQFSEVRYTESAGELKLLSSDAANQRTDSNGQQLKVTHEDEEELVLLSAKKSINSPPRQPATTQEREKALNAAKMFKPQNPFFMVILQLYNVHHSFMLYIPSRFVKYLNGGSKIVKLQVSEEKQWTVRCVRANGCAYLSKGWSIFVNDNHLVEGDVCVFEFIQVKDVDLKVSIFRAHEDASQTNLEK
ncbi:B3 domain-containing transcription factor [Actinidia chinensis var. chinensis]|uniref:B3 domain-containing transcription factor n=1 Tax=Actinidia chinensis var. chinensis TaxID=1590841 RepID=A0A2R6RH89_ACTCC|nr:B3 domain-containing transcription factor [Actinidia chinensis var. chinensis]